MQIQNVSANGILAVNNLALGLSPTPGRTDPALGVKTRKLDWLCALAEHENLLVVLTGQIFNKVTSFEDLSFLVNEGLFQHKRIFLMPNYPSYLKNNEIIFNTNFGVIRNFYPSKVIDTYLQISNDNDDSLILLRSENYESLITKPSRGREWSDNRFVIFEHSKRLVDKWGDTYRKLQVSTKSEYYHQDRNHIYLGTAYRRNKRAGVTPAAAKISCSGEATEIRIPHETHVFDDSIAERVEIIESIRERTSLSVSHEFDPRNQVPKGRNGVMTCLDEIYKASRVSPESYEIIRKLIKD